MCLIHRSVAFFMRKPILIAEAIYGQEEKDNVNKVLDSGWLGSGKYTTELQDKMAAYIGVKHGIFTNSGSSALLLALKALNLPKGSEVITCAAGFPSTLNPIIHAGLKPVVVDAELDTLNIDPKMAKKAMSAKTSAIVFAHAAGNPVDLDALEPILKQIPSVEDNCDALGAMFNGRRTGSFGTLSALSFYASHHITAAGGGGMVLTDDTDLATNMYSLRDWGKTYYDPAFYQNNFTQFDMVIDGVPYDRNYSYDTIGFNMKQVEVGAAFAVAQLKRLPGFVEKRNRNYKRFADYFYTSMNRYFIPVRSYAGAIPSWFFFPFILRDDAPFNRQQLVTRLEEKGIHTRLFFAGNIIRQPALQFEDIKVVGELKNADKLMEDALMIGVHPNLTDKDIDYVIETVNNFVSENE